MRCVQASEQWQFAPSREGSTCQLAQGQSDNACGRQTSAASAAYLRGREGDVHDVQNEQDSEDERCGARVCHVLRLFLDVHEVNNAWDAKEVVISRDIPA